MRWRATFCATAKMGFFRNLTAAEILDQLITIERELDNEKGVTHVVFMGMGEPLANYDQTVKAIRLMTDANGLGISEGKITVSTSGLARRMRQFRPRAAQVQSRPFVKRHHGRNSNTPDANQRQVSNR